MAVLNDAGAENVFKHLAWEITEVRLQLIFPVLSRAKLFVKFWKKPSRGTIL